MDWVATRMDTDFTTEVRFYRLSEALQPYFTALYATSVDCSPGVWVKDQLHPEWAALRFTEGPPPIARVGVGELRPQWPFVANGPTSKAIQFGVTRSRVWGLGLQPAGCNPRPQTRERVTPNWIALLVGPLATNGHCGSSGPGPTQAIGAGPSVKRSAAHSGCSQSVTSSPGSHSTVVA